MLNLALAIEAAEKGCLGDTEGGLSGRDTPLNKVDIKVEKVAKIYCYSLFTFGSKRPSPNKVQLSVGGQALEMEDDTGASLSVISEKTYNNLVSENKAPPLEKLQKLSFAHTPGEEVKLKQRRGTIATWIKRNYLRFLP